MVNIKKIGGLLILGIMLINAGYQFHNLIDLRLVDENEKNSESEVNFSKNLNKISPPLATKGRNHQTYTTQSLETRSTAEDSNNNIENNMNFKSASIVLEEGFNDSQWYDSRWRYRKNITVLASQVSEDLINFPLLIDIFDEDLTLALNSGYDVLFTDQSNNKLAHEIEFFERNYNISYSYLRVWVKLNLSSSLDTEMMMYFGFPFSENQENPNGVWSNGYEAVWHLDEDPSQTIIDSTGVHNGTAYSGSNRMTSSNSQTGKIGSGIVFDGVDDRIITNNLDSNLWGAITLEAWIYHETSMSQKNTGSIITKQEGETSGYLWALRSDHNDFDARLTVEGQSPTIVNGTNYLTEQVWEYLVWVWNGSSELFYVDGILTGVYTDSSITGSSIADSSSVVSIGATTSGNNEQFKGVLDEIRVSKVSRTNNWIATQSANVLNPNLFYTVNSDLEKFQLMGDWPFASLDYRKNITISSSLVAQNLTNYPFLISLIDQDLRDKAQIGAGDVLFTDINGTRLEHEIEKYTYSYNATHSQLFAWVKIPNISSVDDTIITIYYGNNSVIRYDKSNTVWENYEAVWHLSEEEVINEGTKPYAHIDATGNGYNGNQSGNDGITSIVGKGQNFDGINDLIEIDANTMSTASEIQISGWFNLAKVFTNNRPQSISIMNKRLSSSQSFDITLIGTDYLNDLNDTPSQGSLVFGIRNSAGNSAYIWTNTTNWDSGIWYQFVIYHNINNFSLNKIYINGFDDTDDYSICSGSCTFSIGFSGEWRFGGGQIDLGSQGWLKGILDEFRVSKDILDNFEINFTYQLITNPKTYYFISTEFINDFEKPVIVNYGVDDLGTGSAVYWAEITDKAGIKNAYIEINSTSYPLIDNGTYWIYQDSPEFNNTYSFRILNATDIQNVSQLNSTGLENYTFSIDSVFPDVLDWVYYSDLGENGTFIANATDNWGIIDTVQVLIQSCTVCSFNNNSVMVFNGSNSYFSDSIYMTGGTIDFYIVVNDTYGNIFTSTTRASVVNNRSPTVSNSVLVGPYFSNKTLILTYNYTDPENNNNLSEIYWYLNNVLQPQYNNSFGIPKNALLKDDQWNATIIAYDGGYGNTIYTDTITIINSAPVLITSLQTADSSSDLTADYTYSDDDSDILVNISIKWYKNGLLVPELNDTESVSASFTLRDESWFFTMIGFDGEEFSAIYPSNSINISNTVPTAINVKFNDSVIDDNEDFNITYTFFDNDGDLENNTKLIVYWFINGTYNSLYDNKTTIHMENTTAGSFWYYIINVYDGFSYSRNISSSGIGIGTVSNINAPEVSNLYIVLTGTTLRCTLNDCTVEDSVEIIYVFDDIDGDPDATSIFRWYKNSSGAFILQSQYNNLRILPIGALVKGDQWYVNVTPSDGLNIGNETKSDIITVKNLKPVVEPGSEKFLILGGSGEFVEILFTTTDEDLYPKWMSNDLDGDTIVGFEIFWINGSIEISNAWNLTYLPFNYTKKGEFWSFKVRAFDGESWSDNSTQKSVSIINSTPKIENIILSGGSNTDESITLIYDFVDADQDEDYSIINWFINGVPELSALDNITLDSLYFKAGDIISAQLTPYDNIALNNPGSVVSSTFKIIGNSEPEIIVIGTPQIVIYDENNGTLFYTSSRLFAFYNATDSDGFGGVYGLNTDPLLYKLSAEYRWFKNGILQEEITSFEVSSQYLTKGDMWIISVLPFDRYGDSGEWVNSTSIFISNTIPVVESINWNNIVPTSQQNLVVSISSFDNDSDTILTKIRWFVSNVSFVREILTNENETTISNIYYFKDEYVFVMVSLFDGEMVGISVNSSQIKILNSKPIISSITINDNQISYSNDSLTVSWIYIDPDNDLEDTSNASIKWFKNGILQVTLGNQTKIESGNTTKGDNWNVIIRVFDGTDYSPEYMSSEFLYFSITDYLIQLEQVQINSNESTILSNNNLIANYNPIDAVDNDPVADFLIFWYENGIYRADLGNQTLSINDLTKGSEWYFIITVTDNGITWTQNYTSQVIFILNMRPQIIEFNFIYPQEGIDINTRKFYLDDETIRISFDNYDIDGDLNLFTILWFINGIHKVSLNNMTEISSEFLNEGDTWYVSIIPFDQEEYGDLYNSSIIYIESAPKILDPNYSVPDPSSFEPEGVYNIQVITNNTNNPIVKVEIILDKSLQRDEEIKTLVDQIEFTSKLTKVSDLWQLTGIDLFSGNRSEFKNYIGKIITFQIKAYIEINDLETNITYSIWRTLLFNISIEDEAPPRVRNVIIEFDNDDNPTTITFNVEIVDFGSGVKNATLFYLFKQTDSETGSESNLNFKLFGLGQLDNLQGYSSTILELAGDNIYTATVDFDASSSVIILYQIAIFDKEGNFIGNADEDGQNENQAKRFDPDLGLPIEQVIGIIAIIVFFALIFTIIGIKKFRSTEIVGLDVEKVMEETGQFLDSEVIQNLSNHSLGIVISVFHQTHGPLPLFVLPTILSDNLEKLVDLSDRSFSAVRFVEDFESEMQISFDYSISTNIKITSLSYGFSLNRPESRGGSDNITLNFLLHKPYDLIINQFTKNLDPKIHEIHILMDKDAKKELIEEKIKELRNLITRIVLAYQKIYPDEIIEDFLEDQ